jgi:hypothetical protein
MTSTEGGCPTPVAAAGAACAPSPMRRATSGATTSEHGGAPGARCGDGSHERCAGCLSGAVSASQMCEMSPRPGRRAPHAKYWGPGGCPGSRHLTADRTASPEMSTLPYITPSANSPSSDTSTSTRARAQASKTPRGSARLELAGLDARLHMPARAASAPAANEMMSSAAIHFTAGAWTPSGSASSPYLQRRARPM